MPQQNSNRRNGMVLQPRQRTHRRPYLHRERKRTNQNGEEMETMTDNAVNGWLIVYFGTLILSILIFGD